MPTVLTYAILSPLILGFAALALMFLYFAYRYNIRAVLDCTGRLTNGEYYMRALQQVTVGVYLGLSCLLGLFTIRSIDSLGSIGPASMVAAVTICAAVGQYYMSCSLRHLSQCLPIDAMMRAERMPSDHAIAPELHALELKLASFLDRTASDAAEERNQHPSIFEPDPVLQLVSDRVGTNAIWGPRIQNIIRWDDRGAWWTGGGSLRTRSEDQYESSANSPPADGVC